MRIRAPASQRINASFQIPGNWRCQPKPQRPSLAGESQPHPFGRMIEIFPNEFGLLDTVRFGDHVGVRRVLDTPAEP
ncbi:MAG TPA: hypothetical protein VF223_19010 [Trebonia sp.]